MNLSISARSDSPIYEQLFEQISAQIMSGQLSPNFCLPPIRTVAKELGISVITVKKAWELLEQNGFIYSHAGKGCFVSPQAKVHLDNKKTELISERLDKELPYYKNLGISLDALIKIIKEKY